MRAPTNNCKASTFLLCPYCFRFVHKKEIHKHCKHCPFKPDHARASDPLEEAKLLLITRSGFQGTDDLSRYTLNKLREGRVKDKILNDSLILVFAKAQFSRLRDAKGEISWSSFNKM